ncbi:MAG: UDP-N-acetylmuramoyl-L-alanyl-D-glutamate--2,6-diaminopimelate ligase [Leptospira sp.]|nr:UDP-N-acetylmuramoyl-L-alanyl-D-glutamate--2,6-diaminopimelate ligase [Leptospira sp.]
MLIESILKEFSDLELLQGSPNVSIHYVWADSRKIIQDDIFLVPTSMKDQSFLSDAKRKGATVCLLNKGSEFIEKAKQEYTNVLVSRIPAEQIQGYLASFILGHPSRFMKIFAVTGTNGKTTMTHILNHFAACLGLKTGLIGTLHVKYGNQILETGYTTPDSSTLQELLYKMKEDSVEYVFMEASSHGLKLGRTNGMDLYCALFTNITKDHMDFHSTMEDYLDSKFRIFELLSSSNHPDRFGVSLSDAPGGNEMMRKIQNLKEKERIYFVGKGQNFEYKNIELGIDGTSFRFVHNRKNSCFTSTLKIQSNMLGEFNVQNLSLAIAAWIIADKKIESIPEICKSIPKVPGRFDIYYSNDNSKLAVVDYAHTPDALMNILNSCRAMNPTKLICLVGCGGDRDKTKRPEMAKIAEDLSDFVIITSDNPRTEDPDEILNMMESGFSQGFEQYQKIVDRKLAIQKAIEMMPSGGILAVCGKGHENYQIIGREKFHFDDREEVQECFGKENTNKD